MEKIVTPFLLKYIAEHTNGESLEANIALIKHNAKVGAEIAVEYAAHKIKNPNIADEVFKAVVWGGIEPPTQGFSVLCSTD